MITSSPDNDGAANVDSFRSEIQGFRALAVLLVVVFHLWPGWLCRDGCVLRHLGFPYHRTHGSRGRPHPTLRVGRFWARRIRRLLPASLLVLALSMVAVLAVVPATLWQQTARQVTASAPLRAGRTGTRAGFSPTWRPTTSRRSHSSTGRCRWRSSSGLAAARVGLGHLWRPPARQRVDTSAAPAAHDRRKVSWPPLRLSGPSSRPRRTRRSLT